MLTALLAASAADAAMKKARNDRTMPMITGRLFMAPSACI
jgi:hypothetical protein